MQFNDFMEVLPKAVAETNLVFVIYGPPGAAKSALGREIARAAYGDDPACFKVFHGACANVEDMLGVPYVMNSGEYADSPATGFAPPAFWPRSGSGLMACEEPFTAATNVQHNLARLFLDRAIGYTYSLPPGWKLIALSNRLSDQSGIVRPPKHTANRVVHLVMGTPMGDGFAEMGSPVLDKSGKPVRPDVAYDAEAWVDSYASLHCDARVVAFIKKFPEELNTFNAGLFINATQRTWEMLSTFLPYIPSKLLMECASGVVGAPAAAKFVSFINIFHKLPAVELIESKPTEAPVPSEPDLQFAISVVGIQRVVRTVGADKVLSPEANLLFAQWAKYLNRFPVELKHYFFTQMRERVPVLRYSQEMRRYYSGDASAAVNTTL